MDNQVGNFTSSKDMDDKRRFGGVSEEPQEENVRHQYDGLKYKTLYRKLNEWYEQEWEKQAANRYQMALDEDYYDSMQWTQEEADILMERGQAPLVFNEIKPTIDWLIGTERRTRIDHRVLPRKAAKEYVKDAEVKTSLLKYLSDVNKTPFHRSFAFESAAKAGVGWIETGIRGDPTDELLFTRSEDWKNVLEDSSGNELDLSDARYLFRKRWLDEDIAMAMFPDRAELIQAACSTSNNLTDSEEDEVYYMGARVTKAGEDYQSGASGRYLPYNSNASLFNKRSRVKLTECWYKQPVLKRFFNSGDLQNEAFDSRNQEHLEMLKEAGVSLYDRLQMEIRVAIFCEGGIIAESKSPYDHNRIPFVKVTAFKRRRDGAHYGYIRNLRDAQDDLNKRKSKALFILSSNTTIVDDDATDDHDSLRDEVAKPNPYIIKKRGSTVEIKRDIALAEEHLMLMGQDMEHIRNVSGITSENLGRDTNATSGKAIIAKQEQGGISTTQIFDNLRFAVQLVGEMELSNVEQFYTEEKSIRITGEKGNAKHENINEIDEGGELINDITKFHADFVVSEQDYKSSLRQAMFESLFDIVGRLAQMNPQVALNLLDLVIEMADIPNRDALVQRIRQLNGQTDPDEEESPEVAAAKQKQQAMADAQQQLQMQTIETQLAKLVAEKDNLDAKTISQRIQSMYEALQAGQIVSAVPAAAPVADAIMKGAGFNKPADLEAQAAQVEPQMQEPPQQEMIEQPQEPAQQEMQEAVPQQLASAAQGLQQGIETPQNDGVN